MAKYKIAWLPGDGVGNDVMEAARIVLNALDFSAEYIHGDIGWEFWRQEGEPLPKRTVEMMKDTDCALFGAITSKPKEEAAAELDENLKAIVSELFHFWMMFIKYIEHLFRNWMKFNTAIHAFSVLTKDHKIHTFFIIERIPGIRFTWT